MHFTSLKVNNSNINSSVTSKSNSSPLFIHSFSLCVYVCVPHSILLNLYKILNPKQTVLILEDKRDCYVFFSLRDRNCTCFKCIFIFCLVNIVQIISQNIFYASCLVKMMTFFNQNEGRISYYINSLDVSGQQVIAANQSGRVVPLCCPVNRTVTIPQQCFHLLALRTVSNFSFPEISRGYVKIAYLPCTFLVGVFIFVFFLCKKCFQH